MQQRVLVLGSYGFIGAAVVRALRGAGCIVTGLGRAPRRVDPGYTVLTGDLSRMLEPADWQPVLKDIDLVVNCAGALQDQRPGELEAVHHLAIAALAKAAGARAIEIVQISAVGASRHASTEFMRSKARGDAALRASDARVWVLRPGLVLGPTAFGGTLLLRTLAAVPVVQPIAMADARIQSVALDDVARAVVEAATGSLPPGQYDLVEEAAQPLNVVVRETRRWLGFAPARWTLNMPGWITIGISTAADLLGRLGWRSPLRSTAIHVLRDGVLGDPGPYLAVTGRPMTALAATYSGFDAHREDRLAARMAVLMPVAVTMLSLFWLVSGVIGLWQIERAAETLVQVGWPGWVARVSVAGWAVVDMMLGLAILYRPWAGLACLGMAAVSVFYLVSSAVLTPALWSDPLGPMVKVGPGLILALITHQLLEDR
ncbi:SDR family oxidoreductase [Rhodobacteraceae bacterium M382]|nr:SDR family oxidoreductase [Rhodobacteraceae bacterium M382]